MSVGTARTVLNHLIEICKDSERGYLAAAAHVADPSLKAFFTETAAERRAFAADLLPHAQRLGGEAAAEGSALAAVHRGWMNLKGRLPGHHDGWIIAEAERGEQAALDAYRDALSEMLPPTVVDLLEQQCAAVARAHHHVRALERTKTGRRA